DINQRTIRMLTCMIRYEIDPSKHDDFRQCVRNLGQANYACAQERKFILRADRRWLKLASSQQDARA
ncbi:MAG: hypothetical protein ACPHFU_04855, partial [Paracoccaceae bacterium]